MYFFSGVPILWGHTVSPACFRNVLKTTGPESTNPPAVIGRFSASCTGANTPPVEFPSHRRRSRAAWLLRQLLSLQQLAHVESH